MNKHLIFFSLFVSFFFGIIQQCSATPLVAHIIPHSHCDPGWLKTYKEYYDQNVNRILTNVYQYLSADSKRTFIWAEISFFKLWWQDQNPEVREKVKTLVKNGQFEFVGGGWVQNDEATVNLELIVNQITEGHEFLLHTFNDRPRIAWQVDPFGHSSLTPTLFSSIGYQALVINRIHYSLKSSYKTNKHMEFMWKSCRHCSPSLRERLKIFTHVLHTHYAAPIGFDWEEHSPTISANNLHSRAEILVQSLRQRAESYRSNQLLVPWGDDFKFQNAEIQFSNMDKLIEYINSSPNFNMQIKYSTLSGYFDSLRENSQVSYPYYEGDFYPYADNEDSYWTGYYTSRPSLKASSRETSSILHSAEMLYALAQVESKVKNTEKINWVSLSQGLRQARRDLGLVTHHDGTTGTSRSRVVTDYLGMLHTASEHAGSVIAASSALLLAKTHIPVLRQGYFIFPKRKGYYPIIFHNSLGWWRREIASIEVSHDSVHVVDDSGEPVPFQISPILKHDLTLDNHFKLNLLVEIPPLGLKTYFLSFSETTAPSKATHQSYSGQSVSGSLFIESSSLRVILEKGEVAQVFFKDSGEVRSFSPEYRHYVTSRSGAYIFRSEGQQPVHICSNSPQVTIVKGPLVQEIHSVICGLYRVIRLYNFTNFYEDQQPPIEIVHYAQVNQVNREFVVRYNTSLNSESHFFTDNGLEMRQRITLQEKPERNYYPMYSYSSIEEESSGKQLTVLSSQCMGVTSPSNGVLEVMLHRSLERDDGRGLSEGVRDTSTVPIKHWIMLQDTPVASKWRPRSQLFLEHPLRTVFSYDESDQIDTWLSKYYAIYSPLNEELPSDVHLLSLKSRNFVSNDIVTRFLHLPVASSSGLVIPETRQTSVNLNEFFSTYDISRIRKTSLTLNQEGQFSSPAYPLFYEKVPALGETFVRGNNDESNRQNSNEDGVFISKSALEHAKKNQAIYVSQDSPKSNRQLLGLDSSIIDIEPLEIQTFLLDLKLNEIGEQKLETETKSLEFLEELRTQQKEDLKRREQELEARVEQSLANNQQQPHRQQLPPTHREPSNPPSQQARPQNGQFIQQQPPVQSQKLEPFKNTQKAEVDGGIFRPFNVTRIEIKLTIFFSSIGICLILAVFLRLQLRPKRSKHKV